MGDTELSADTGRTFRVVEEQEVSEPWLDVRGSVRGAAGVKPTAPRCHWQDPGLLPGGFSGGSDLAGFGCRSTFRCVGSGDAGGRLFGPGHGQAVADVVRTGPDLGEIML